MGKDSIFLKGLAPGILSIHQWVYAQHKLDLVYTYMFFFFFFLWGGHKGGGWIWEDWKEFIIYQIALCEIPK